METEYFGYGVINKLHEIVKYFNAKNIFLVTGKKSFHLSGAEEIIKNIFENISYTKFDQFSENPNIEEVKQGVLLYRRVNPDMVVAVGGGSVIDMAKAINILAYQDDKPEVYISEEKRLEKIGRPLIAIPTTAGTGSESTRFSTIYIDKTKHSLNDEILTLPAVSIIDPTLTYSMPRYLTASTGLDALSQAIESLWSVHSTNESQKFAEKALKLAFKSLKRAANDPDGESRMNMTKAANLSGKAINITKTTACHSIAYPITSYFDVAHGHAVALTIPQLLEFNYNVDDKSCNDKRGAEFVKNQIENIINLMECKDVFDAKEKFYALMEQIGVKTKLSDLNIDKNKIKLIIDKGFTEDRMKGNPRILTKSDLQLILEKII